VSETAFASLTWESIVRDHAPWVLKLAYRLTGNRHDAEDLAQEAFIRIFRSLASFQPGSIEGWIRRITVNIFLDQVRRESRLRFVGLGDAADRVSDPGASPDARWDEHHFDPDVEQALAALPPEFRKALLLCFVEGYSYDEAAEMLGTKAGTVASRIHRGRSHLRIALADRAPQVLPPSTPVPMDQTHVPPTAPVRRRATPPSRPEPSRAEPARREPGTGAAPSGRYGSAQPNLRICAANATD
jgi:RNA polymerase sigma-70 factor (ECF subfamily)